VYFLKEIRVNVSDGLIKSIIDLLGEESILFDLK